MVPYQYCIKNIRKKGENNYGPPNCNFVPQHSDTAVPYLVLQIGFRHSFSIVGSMNLDNGPNFTLVYLVPVYSFDFKSAKSQGIHQSRKCNSFEDSTSVQAYVGVPVSLKQNLKLLIFFLFLQSYDRKYVKIDHSLLGSIDKKGLPNHSYLFVLVFQLFISSLALSEIRLIFSQMLIHMIRYEKT